MNFQVNYLIGYIVTQIVLDAWDILVFSWDWIVRQYFFFVRFVICTILLPKLDVFAAFIVLDSQWFFFSFFFLLSIFTVSPELTLSNYYRKHVNPNTPDILSVMLFDLYHFILFICCFCCCYCFCLNLLNYLLSMPLIFGSVFMYIRSGF